MESLHQYILFSQENEQWKAVRLYNFTDSAIRGIYSAQLLILNDGVKGVRKDTVPKFSLISQSTTAMIPTQDTSVAQAFNSLLNDLTWFSVYNHIYEPIGHESFDTTRLSPYHIIKRSYGSTEEYDSDPYNYVICNDFIFAIGA